MIRGATVEKSTGIETLDLEDYISSDTFKPTGRELGMGCWGKVDEYVDTVGQKWALKMFHPNETAQKQMVERGWIEDDIMRREAIPLNAAYRHVVPRIIERDKNGKTYIAMPVHKKNLSENIKYLDLKQALTIARDIADALGYTHEQKELGENGRGVRKAHGDVKPANVMIKDGRGFLNDFGSQTCISIGGSGNERGPHGDKNYQAPECSQENAKPSTRADVWSLGSILYEAIAKQGIYNSLGREDDLQKGVNKKIKKLKASGKVKIFLRNCLKVNEFDRFEDGRTALGELEEIIAHFGAKKTIKDYARKFTLPIGLPIVLAGMFVYGATTYEPQKLEMPKSNIQRMLYPLGKSDEQKLEFDIEDINDLPAVSHLGMIGNEMNRDAKLSTDNRIVAYFAKTHGQALTFRGGLYADTYTDNQFKTYIAYTTGNERQFRRLSRTPWLVWAKSIEVALNQAKTKNGKVDLEDVMAISRLGIEKVAEAKNVSRSVDYKSYKDAKDINGKYIISKAEKSFINTWMAYYKGDVD